MEGRVLEVGAFTGALVGFLQRKRPDLEWHALDGVEEAVEVGRKRVPEVVWHLGWAEEVELPPFDTLLLLSVFPEGLVDQGLESRLAPEAFWKRFAFFERLPLFARLLRPGGLLVYGHGPFLGKSPEGVEEGLRRLGFDRVERVGEGEYFLVLARKPEALAAVRLEEREAPSPEEAEEVAVALEEARALLEAGRYAEALALLPEEAEGEAAYLRGRALFALSRHAEAEEALRRALSEEAEDLRALALVELGEYERARGASGPWRCGAGGTAWPWAGSTSPKGGTPMPCGSSWSRVFPRPTSTPGRPWSASPRGCAASPGRGSGRR